MWVCIANKCGKFHILKDNQSENIPNSFRGWLLFLKHPVEQLQRFNNSQFFASLDYAII